MSDLDQAPATPTGGEPATAPVETGTTAPAPASAPAGQADGQRGPVAGQAVSAPDADAFFDPSKLPEELKPAYKQMQAAYTKKTQEIAKHRQKIEAYDAFSRDPVGSLQQLASQYGMSLTRAEAKQALQQQGQQASGEDWQPKTWEDVFARAEERAERRILAKLGPVVQNVQNVQRMQQVSSIEGQLNTIDPNWRIYEDDMRRNLQTHPTLVSDVQMLYRLSVPEEVYTSRAVQAAMQKFQSKVNQAAVGTKTESPRSMPAPKSVDSFQDAVEEARRMLAEQGR